MCYAPFKTVYDFHSDISVPVVTLLWMLCKEQLLITLRVEIVSFEMCSKFLMKFYINIRTVHWYLIKMTVVQVFSNIIEIWEWVLIGPMAKKAWSVIANIDFVLNVIPKPKQRVASFKLSSNENEETSDLSRLVFSKDLKQEASPWLITHSFFL